QFKLASGERGIGEYGRRRAAVVAQRQRRLREGKIRGEDNCHFRCLARCGRVTCRCFELERLAREGNSERLTILALLHDRDDGVAVIFPPIDVVRIGGVRGFDELKNAARSRLTFIVDKAAAEVSSRRSSGNAAERDGNGCSRARLTARENKRERQKDAS